MLCKEMRCLKALSLVMAVTGYLATWPVLAGDTLKIGGIGSALGSMRLLGSAFEKSHPGITVTVLPSLGSSGGINAVSKDVIDIGVSGRLLTDEEWKPGLDMIEYARTPLGFAVKADNPISGLRKDEFIKMITGETPAWPNGQRVRPVLRPSYDAEVIIARQAVPEIGAAIDRALLRADSTVALTSQEAADVIESIPGAFGLSTLILIRSEKRQLKLLSFNGVVPSAANVANRSYPLRISLYLVTKPNPPERIRQFIDFVRSEPSKRLLEEAGSYAVGPKD